MRGQPRRPADRVVVLGAGEAGGWAALTLRAKGFDGEIALVGTERHAPYERPPLSKEFLRGETTVEGFRFKEPTFYDEAAISTRFGRSAVSINRDERSVELDDGSHISYDRLILALGARPRALSCPGAKAPGLHYLRTISDAEALATKLRASRHLTVIGGGLIGMEVAASAVAMGVRVTVVEQANELMSRVLPAAVSDKLGRLHAAHGVELLTGTSVTEIEPGEPLRVLRTDGREILTDCILVGIGSVPNDELAAAAGLEVDDGVIVDEFGVTSDPCIFAAGDVTRHYSPAARCHRRLESSRNAQRQGAAVAANVAGEHAPYDDVAWSWTDQYDFNVQIAGNPTAWETVETRGASSDQAFTLAGWSGARLVGVVSVNQPREMRQALRELRDTGRKPTDKGPLHSANPRTTTDAYA